MLKASDTAVDDDGDIGADDGNAVIVKDGFQMPWIEGVVGLMVGGKDVAG